MKKFKFKIYPLEPPIITRQANKNDMLMQLAELIYQSNPKMFSYYHPNQVYGCEDLVNMILTPNSALCYKNAFVASQKTNVWGVLIALTPETNLSYNYKWFKNKKESYKITMEKYFENLPKKLKHNTVFIPHLFVHEAYRNFTIGRKLILTCEDYFRLKGYTYTEVYCVEGNTLLENLLKNMNFKQVDRYLDFATPDEKQYVKIYRREIKKDEYYK